MDIEPTQRVGFCECGCGEETTIATRTNRAHGHVTGVPYRFRPGHSQRNKLDIKGYRKGINGKGTHLHRMRAEHALGRQLPPKAVVHHADGSMADDAPLVICQNQAYHMLLHARMRVRAAGGNPNTDQICTRCKTLLPKTAFGSCRSGRGGRDHRCRPCNAASCRDSRQSWPT